MDFINTFIRCGTISIITKPTRLTDSTAKIIDHIITNITNQELLPMVMKTFEVSEHHPVFR